MFGRENLSSTPAKFFETQRTMLAVEKWGAKDNKRKQRSEIFRPPFFDRLFSGNERRRKEPFIDMVPMGDALARTMASLSEACLVDC